MEDQPGDPWIWGIFYYNRNDRRLLVPKRIAAMGWTVNFTNPYSVMLFVAVIILIVLVSWLA